MSSDPARRVASLAPGAGRVALTPREDAAAEAPTAREDGAAGAPPQVTPRPGAAPGNAPAPRGDRAVLGAVVLAAVLIVAGLLVQQLISLLLAAMITVLVSLPLSWCAERLRPLGLARPLGALVGLLVGLAVVGVTVYLLLPSLIDQARTLINSTPRLVHAAEVKLSSATGQRPGFVAQQLQNAATTFVRRPSHLIGPIASISLSVATVLGGLVIGVITAYYIAARPEPLIRGLLSLFSERARPDALRALRRIRTAWMGWMVGLGISMLLIGIMLYLTLHFLVGLPFALVFSVLSALAETVPYIGALASGVPPVAFALTISPGTAVAVLAIYVAVHQVEANLIGPLIMSRAVHLHPAVIAFGVVAVGEVFGFLGLIVAVPILCLAAILLDELWTRRRATA